MRGEKNHSFSWQVWREKIHNFSFQVPKEQRHAVEEWPWRQTKMQKVVSHFILFISAASTQQEGNKKLEFRVVEEEVR